MSDLLPIFVDEELAELMLVDDGFWYLIDDNHRVVAGPFSSKSEASKFKG